MLVSEVRGSLLRTSLSLTVSSCETVIEFSTKNMCAYERFTTDFLGARNSSKAMKRTVSIVQRRHKCRPEAYN